MGEGDPPREPPRPSPVVLRIFLAEMCRVVLPCVILWRNEKPVRLGHDKTTSEVHNAIFYDKQMLANRRSRSEFWSDVGGKNLGPILGHISRNGLKQNLQKHS